jgi:manganese transport protein
MNPLERPRHRSSYITKPLPESFRTIQVPKTGSPWRKLAAFTGPGLLVAVGYMDPGNWATGLEAGSAFGYSLLSVVALASAMGMVLQVLCARLGIATGRDLARLCKEAYPRPVSLCLWLLCELAIVACDLAEVIGTAIGLKLLVGLPLIWGVFLTATDVVLILKLQRKGFRRLEAVVAALLILIAGCFAYELLLSKPMQLRYSQALCHRQRYSQTAACFLSPSASWVQP